MEVGVEVWLKPPKGDQSWIATVILSKEFRDGKWEIGVKNDETDEIFMFRLDNENEDHENVKLRNDPTEGLEENLINLPYLHEPAILFNLEGRYFNSNIYTYTGPILIAMNPFKSVPLYSTQILESYYNLGLLKSQGIDNPTPLPPHVYAIADASYRDMMKVIMHGYSGGANSIKASANQCVLISGESGAGKTESTKIVLKYLTTVGNSTGSIQLESGSVMDKILQSNPILEAFGNARTLRNDNSSRFGKFIELNFNRRGHLIGGTIRTYLLEKVRLPCQQLGERNFHVFYQLCSGASEEERAVWQLLPVQDYWYTNQGDIYALRHVDDKDEFRAMRAALKTLNFAEEHRVALLNCMAGLLHLGQVQFQADADGEGSTVSADPEVIRSLQLAAQLFGVPVPALERALTVRMIVARTETVYKKQNPMQASDSRDALSKALYGKLFDWIVWTINQSIRVDPAQIRADIGVLDIFGFECFKNNSFEQLCINYTNETLQQQFNQFVFKMEQIEYEAEKIEWSFIEFPDNQDCLDLIEHKQKGMLAYLDDECRLPGATDEKLASRLYKSFESHHRFSATPAQKRDSKFCIKHYAGQVIYSTQTFIEKNKDELPKEADLIMQASTVTLVALVFQPPAVTPSATPTTGKGGGDKTLSVGTQFKEQLGSLMVKIYATSPHYIRCLKPNDENIADNFNRRRTAEQLRYGGVLEAVRVARSGFPVRLTHAEFYSRYRPLANPFNPLTDELPRQLQHRVSEAKKLCEDLLLTLWDDSVPEVEVASKRRAGVPVQPVRYGRSRRISRIMDVNTWKGKLEIPRESLQLGVTKLFLRKAAHDLLEARRSRRLASSACRIQCNFRGHLYRQWFVNHKWAVKLLQRVARGFLARCITHHMRLQVAVKKLQSWYRMQIAYFRFNRFIQATILLQSGYRGRCTRKVVNELRHFLRVLNLQRTVRGLVAMRKFHRLRHASIALQCCLRRLVAKRELTALRLSAKDMGLLKQSNDALKQEIEQLRARAAEESRRAGEKAAAAVGIEAARLTIEMAEVKESFTKETQQRVLAESKLAKAELIIVTLRGRLELAEDKVESTAQSLVHAEEAWSQLQHQATETEASLQSMHQQLESVLLSNQQLSGLLASANANNSNSSQFSSNQRPTPTTILTPVPTASILSTPSVVHSPFPTSLSADVSPPPAEHSKVVEALNKERAARAQLDEEVARLRSMTLSLNAQLDNMRRSSTSSSISSSSVPSVSRRPDVEPKRRPSKGPISIFPSVTSRPNSPDPSEDSNRRPPLAPHTQPATQHHSKHAISKSEANAAALGEFGWDDDEDEDDTASVRSNGSLSSSTSPHTVLATAVAANGIVSASSSISSSNSIKAPIRRNSRGSNASDSAAAAAAVAAAAATVAANTSHNTALGTYEKNLENFRAKLRQGFRGLVWEGLLVRVEVSIRLDAKGEVIFEQTNKGRFAIFSSKREISSIKISELDECIAGAEVAQSTADSSCLMTIVAKKDGAGRILAVELPTVEERNCLLTGLRTLASAGDMHATPSTAHSQPATSRDVAMTRAAPAATASATSTSTSTGSAISSRSAPASFKPLLAVPRGRRQSVRDQVLEEALAGSNNSNSSNSSSTNSGITSSSSSSSSSSSGIISGSNPLHKPSGTVSSLNSRRGSKHALAASQTTPAPAASAPVVAPVHNDAAMQEMKKQLQQERVSHERMVVQMLTLTNDLNERDKTIAELRAKEAGLQQAITTKDRMYEQDAMMRMQLGKRLEQVLMDKEDAVEQLELMMEKMESIRASFALVTGGNMADM